MNILGLIPARGGSKGVKKKNIKLLGGKPLIQYTIDAAKTSTSITDIVVSTDDEAIAAICTTLGAYVPELRPARLATDSSPTIDTVIYTLNFYEKKGIHYDAVCLLQPTSPFRTAADIDGAVTAFKQQATDSLISVLPVPHEYNPHWVYEVDEESNLLRIATGEETIISRRQALPNAYHRDGAIYITKSSVIKDQKSLYGTSIGYYLSSPKKHINIDTLADWRTAEKMIHMPFIREILGLE